MCLAQGAGTASAGRRRAAVGAGPPGSSREASPFLQERSAHVDSVVAVSQERTPRDSKGPREFVVAAGGTGAETGE